MLRVIAWNLNHRARRRSIPGWVTPALAGQRPDVVVLTEYVEGPGHLAFIEALAASGLEHHALSEAVAGHNQVLVAAKQGLRRGALRGPAIHPAVPSNVLHVVIDGSALDLLAIRIPAFPPKERALKRMTWEWLLGAAEAVPGRSVIAGDFNTAPGDGRPHCGDCLEQLVSAGWQRAAPVDGFSWKHRASGRGRQIDHVFCGADVGFQRAEYSWSFLDDVPDAAAGRVGTPDHAMVIVDLNVKN